MLCAPYFSLVLLRPLAREAVGRVGLHELQLESGGGDVRQIELSLAGSGDARGPELGLARGARGDLRAR